MKRAGRLATLVLALIASAPSATWAWSCSSEEPLTAPLSPEERARVAAEVERERQSAAEHPQSVDEPSSRKVEPATRAQVVVGARTVGDASE